MDVRTCAARVPESHSSDAPTRDELLRALSQLLELAQAEYEALDRRCFADLQEIVEKRCDVGAFLACHEERLRALTRETPELVSRLAGQVVALDRRIGELVEEYMHELEAQKQEIERLRSWLFSHRQVRRSSALRGQYFDGRF